MAKGEVRVPNDIVDDLGYGDELAAWVWLARTRNYDTNMPTIGVRELTRLTGWSYGKTHRFLAKFNRITRILLTNPGEWIAIVGHFKLAIFKQDRSTINERITNCLLLNLPDVNINTTLPPNKPNI